VEPGTQRGTDAIVIKFAAQTCRNCPVRDQCTHIILEPDTARTAGWGPALREGTLRWVR